MKSKMGDKIYFNGYFTLYHRLLRTVEKGNDLNVIDLKIYPLLHPVSKLRFWPELKLVMLGRWPIDQNAPDCKVLDGLPDTVYQEMVNNLEPEWVELLFHSDILSSLTEEDFKLWDLFDKYIKMGRIPLVFLKPDNQLLRDAWESMELDMIHQHVTEFISKFLGFPFTLDRMDELHTRLKELG